MDIIKLLGDERLLHKYGALGVSKIQKRIRKGLQPDYSKAYLAARRKLGIVGADKVVLERTGESMRAMTHTVFADRQQVDLMFMTADAERIMGYHDRDGAGRNKVKRPFFFLTDEEKSELSSIIIDDISELLITTELEIFNE